MNEINQTAENIKRLEAFIKNIKMNFNDHKKQAKNSYHLDEIENSIAFLKDYNEVTNELVKVMEAYDMKTSGEIRF
jgi:archaellum component FlaC